MSQLEEVTGGRVRSTAPSGWAMLRHGWPVLLLCFGFVWAQVVQPLGDAQAGSAFALSRAALAEGRWWTVLTHMFGGGLSGMVFAVIAFLAGCTAVTARDPDWMGGWWTPVMFVGCGLVAALVHLLTADGAPLASAWPAVLGLLAFWLSSRRWPRWASDGERVEKARPDTWLARGLNSAWAWLYLWGFAFFPGSAHVIDLPFALNTATGFALVAGGAAVIFGLSAWGGVAQRIVGVFQIVAVLAVTGAWLVERLSDFDLDIPFAVAVLASLVFGALLGRPSRPAALV